MIPSDHFVRFYNEVFKFLDEKNGLEKYYQEISRHQEMHCCQCFMEKGLQGMEEYWGNIRKEENCVSSSWIEEDVRYSHMKKCPSLSKVLDSDAEACEKYCLHCAGWILPLMTKCGFYHLRYQHSLHEPECFSLSSDNREKVEEILQDLKKQGIKYIFSNLCEAEEVEKNRAHRIALQKKEEK